MKLPNTMNRMFSAFFLLCLVSMACTSGKNEKQIPARLVLSDTIMTQNCLVKYTESDRGGNTSVANDNHDIFKWSGKANFTAEDFGYYLADGIEIPYIKRNRDLGQTFTFKGIEPKAVDAISVRLGFGSNVVRNGMYGQAISLQLFEISGTPIIDNNSTDSTTEALHGFPHNRPIDNISHERDDFIKGESYQSIGLIRGYRFPTKTDFGFQVDEDISPNHPGLKGKFLTFHLPENNRFDLQSGKSYAIIIMIDSVGTDRGFTLANLFYGTYSDGHGIRREGNGVFPPPPAHPESDFSAKENHAAYDAAQLPENMEQRSQIQPGTNGYPDVDTWRDLEFYIHSK